VLDTKLASMPPLSPRSDNPDVHKRTQPMRLTHSRTNSPRPRCVCVCASLASHVPEHHVRSRAGHRASRTLISRAPVGRAEFHVGGTLAIPAAGVRCACSSACSTPWTVQVRLTLTLPYNNPDPDPHRNPACSSTYHGPPSYADAGLAAFPPQCCAPAWLRGCVD
jgi:hypothetical protein